MPEQNKPEQEKFTGENFNELLLKKKDKLDKELRVLSNAKSEDDLSPKDLKEFEFFLKDYGENSGLDRLTYLNNRKALVTKGVEFFDQLESSAEEKRSLSVISLDVDFFKAYNEISHTFGDVALQVLSRVLLKNLGETGFSVRLGGEEIFLVIEKNETDLAGKAEKIRREIEDELNKFIDETDGLAGKEKGETRNFLERRVLMEKRSRASFEAQMQISDKYKKAITTAIEIGLLPKGSDFTPADIVLFLKDIEANFKDQELIVKAKKIRDMIPFEIGTATIGAAKVEFTSDSQATEEDAAEIKLYLELEGLPAKDYFSMKFLEIYQDIKESVEDKIVAEEIIAKIKYRRFGKIINIVNSLAEEQKKTERNKVKIEKNIDMSQVDQVEKKAVEAPIRLAYKEITGKLEQRNKKKKKIYRDFAIEKFEDLKNKGVTADQQSSLISQISEVQKLRYNDPLTLTENYEYLTGVVPKDIEQCKNAGQDFAMVSLDLDNLKAVNETGGHNLGDVVLMQISESFQELLSALDKNKALKAFSPTIKKIKETGIEPSFIRAGGEEFLITLPGLNTAEAHDLFVVLRDEVTKKTKATITKTNKDEAIKEYLHNTLKYENPEEREKYGTMTAGIVSLSDSVNLIEADGKINAGKMREIADAVGERLKKEKFADQTTGRGRVWEHETFELISKLDDALQENRILVAETRMLQIENKEARDKFREEIAELQKKLIAEKEASKVRELREIIRKKIQE